MTARPAPDILDARVPLLVYAAVTMAAGLYVYAWPDVVPADLRIRVEFASIGSEGFWIATRVVAAVITWLGCCAAGLAAIADRQSRGTALLAFAGAHVLFGSMFWAQWQTIVDGSIPAAIGYAPLVAGVTLLSTAIIARMPLPAGGPPAARAADAVPPRARLSPRAPGGDDTPVRRAHDALALDTRVVFRVYAFVAFVIGTWMFLWGASGNRTPLSSVWDRNLPAIPWGFASLATITGMVIVGASFWARSFMKVEDPVARRRGLYWFGAAHAVVGAYLLQQWEVVWRDDVAIPALVAWTPLLVGLFLLQLAWSADGMQAKRARWARRSVEDLRSDYEEQIRQAARQEERARLARDLHDAVKQQLFVVHTAAATAQARFDSDADGARGALDQIRAASREATTELEAMLEQLQAAPIENAGLVEALKKQAEALRFRTGADVAMEIADLPPNTAVPPGTHEALFRIAQEALSNVARHARATHVSVVLDTIESRLRLQVRDNGAGRAAEPGGGMGLRNMEARATELGGTFAVTSTAGEGTLVEARLPLDSTSPKRYGRMAIGWAALALVQLVGSSVSRTSLRPLFFGVFVFSLVACLRFVVAWRRVQHRS